MFLLLWIDRRFTIKRPALFSLYVAVYTAFRTFEETLRIDPSNHFLGERINFWVSLVGLRRLGLVLRLVAVPAQGEDPHAEAEGASYPAGAADGGAQEPRPVVQLGSSA